MKMVSSLVAKTRVLLWLLDVNEVAAVAVLEMEVERALDVVDQVMLDVAEVENR